MSKTLYIIVTKQSSIYVMLSWWLNQTNGAKTLVFTHLLTVSEKSKRSSQGDVPKSKEIRNTNFKITNPRPA